MQADYAEYPSRVRELQRQYMSYPRAISIETLVRCNAKCVFCPYPTSARQGQEMSDELFAKIIDDLSEIPRDHPCSINLHRINEPLLDPRMERFIRLVHDKLPGASQRFWSNGTMLRQGGFEWMAEFPRATLTVSLNSMDEDEHIRLMGFGLSVVLRGLDYVHDLAVAGRFPLPVTLCAPFVGAESAARFQEACKLRWPRFVSACRPFFQWMGESGAGSQERVMFGLPSEFASRADAFACAQWFDLHTLANGYVTKCCIDETGYVGHEEFDASRHNVLDIYRRRLALRRDLPQRRTVPGCQGCLHLG